MPPNMNNGTAINETGFVTQHKHLPGATKQVYLSFKSISCEPEEDALLFYVPNKNGGGKCILRQFNDEEVPNEAKYMGHMTTTTNTRAEYSGVLNLSHTYDV